MAPDAFLRDFDMYFCKLFDGARHDSGDPFAWGERLIEHYRRNRVDPRTKTLIFSDQLTIPIAIDNRAAFWRPRADFLRYRHQPDQRPRLRAINIVIKMTECNGQPVAKVSDSRARW